MAKKIFLEVDEEITSAIDKLAQAEDTDVSLVFPKESGLLQSVINLKLLKKQAESMGKNISVITGDRVGRNLAEQIGLSVSDQSGPKREDLPQKIAESQEKVPIEFRKNPRDQGEAEEEIMFKKESLDEKLGDLSVKEDEEIGTAKGDDGDKEEGADKSVKVKGTDDGEGSKGFKIKFPLKKFGTLVVITLLGLLVFGYIYLPRVEVTIAVASEKREFETEIKVDKSEKESDLDKGVLSGEFIEFTKEESKKYNATGKKSIGTKASGVIKINNTYSTTAQTLVAGTRFSSSGLVFTSTSNVTVPGYTDPGGGIDPGEVNVTVEAEKVGANYNVAASSSFAIVAFEGTDKYTKIVGSNAGAFTGGDSREATVVSSSDISKAKNEFAKELTDSAKAEAKKKISEEKILADEALKVEIAESNTNPGLDGEADQFTVTAKASVKALAYVGKDLEEAYDKQAKKEGLEIKQLVDNGYQDSVATITDVDMEKGVFDIGLKSDIFLSAIMDQNAIRDEIIGQTKDKSEGYILGLEGVKDVELKFWPGFLKRVPRIRSHVIIKAEVSEVEADDTEGDDAGTSSG